MLRSSSVPLYFLFVNCTSMRTLVLCGQHSVVGRENIESRLIVGDHPEDMQLFCIGIPALDCSCSGFDGRLNGSWTFIANRFDQSEFVSSIHLRPPESGDKFGMGNGFIHISSLFKSYFLRLSRQQTLKTRVR